MDIKKVMWEHSWNGQVFNLVSHDVRCSAITEPPFLLTLLLLHAQMEPLHDRLLIKPFEEEPVSAAAVSQGKQQQQQQQPVAARAATARAAAAAAAIATAAAAPAGIGSCF
jgi:hypothetical protein